MSDAPMHHSPMTGRFVEEGSDTWYRIDGYDRQPPFFMTLAGDSDLWAFISTAGSLTAGRREQEGVCQVKEEVLTRWGELGLRMRDGQVHFNPVLLDAVELPANGALTFTWARVPFAYRRGTTTRLRVQTADGWRGCPDLRFDPHGVLAVQAELA